jgi:hypothetical protein
MHKEKRKKKIFFSTDLKLLAFAFELGAFDFCLVPFVC